MKYAILVGNGLSIAYNDGMRIGPLTEALLERFEDQGGELAALAAEARTAAEHAGEPEKGFEELLGPFDAVSAMIQNLPGLRAGSSLKQFRMLAEALDASREIHLQGVAHALDLIAELGSFTGDIGPIDQFGAAIAELAKVPEELVIATLSYDGLLQAGFLRDGVDRRGSAATLATCDLGHGMLCEEVEVDFSDFVLKAYSLRDSPDFLDDRAVVLNLHGSLGWLRAPGDAGRVLKFRIQDLRNSGYWEQLAVGETEWTPVVVLTSRKAELVREWPFSLAYASFASALMEADRWLLAGYGRGDEPINEIYKRAALLRGKEPNPPRVLVIGHGERETLLSLTAEALGIAREWITACWHGIPEAVTCEHWDAWASDD